MDSLKDDEKSVRKWTRYILYIGINLFLFAIVFWGTHRLCSLSYHWCYEIFGAVTEEKEPGHSRIFEVNKGDNMKKVSKRLKERGIIVNEYTFLIRTKLMDQEKIILRPGKYTLNTSMNYEEIINELTFSE